MIPPPILSRPEVNFHDLPPDATVKIYDGMCTVIPSGAMLEVWRTEGDDSLLIRMRRPLEDGTQSLLRFSLTRDAALALHGLLDQQLYPELCKVCNTPGCLETRGPDFHAGESFGSKQCDYTGTPPYADAEWAGKNQDPTDLMCEWCAGTGHPHGDESYGICKCPNLRNAAVSHGDRERQPDTTKNDL